MSAPIYTSLNLNSNQLENAVVHKGVGFPGTAVQGQAFYRTDEDIFYIYNGSGWAPVNPSGGMTFKGTLAIGGPLPAGVSGDFYLLTGVTGPVDGAGGPIAQEGDQLVYIGTEAGGAYNALTQTIVQGNVVSATETTAGIAELATQTETNTGVDDERILTSLKLGNYAGWNLTNQIYVDATLGNDTTGNGNQNKPFATITKALTVATSSMAIHIMPGTYVEDLSITGAFNGLSLIGERSNDLSGGVVIVQGTMTINNPAAQLYFENIEFSRLDDAAVVSVTDSQSIKFFQCHFAMIAAGTSKLLSITQTTANNIAIFDTCTAGVLTNQAGTGLEVVNVQGSYVYVKNCLIFPSLHRITSGAGQLIVYDTQIVGSIVHAFGFLSLINCELQVSNITSSCALTADGEILSITRSRNKAIASLQVGTLVKTGTCKLYIDSSSMSSLSVVKSTGLVGRAAQRSDSQFINGYNGTGGLIAAYRVVKTLGTAYSAAEDCVDVEPMTSAYDHIAGLLLTATDTLLTGFMLKKGLVKVPSLNTTLNALGDPVYVDSTGALFVTAPSTEDEDYERRVVGYVAELAADGTIYFDPEQYGGANQVWKVLSPTALANTFTTSITHPFGTKYVKVEVVDVGTFLTVTGLDVYRPAIGEVQLRDPSNPIPATYLVIITA